MRSSGAAQAVFIPQDGKEKDKEGDLLCSFRMCFQSIATVFFFFFLVKPKNLKTVFCFTTKVSLNPFLEYSINRSVNYIRRLVVRNNK